MYPLNGSRNGRFVEKASSVAAESERARRVFRDRGDRREKKDERRGRNGDERTSSARNETHRETTETGGSEGGKEGVGRIGEGERRERGDGRRGGEEDATTSGGEEHRDRDEGEKSPGEEPPRSFRPLARQTALRPTQKSRALFAPLVQVYIYGPIPLSVVTGRSARSLRSSSARRWSTRMQMVRR